MPKKGFPGLVLVPPSDRTMLRRRILRWSLFIIALIWCASTLSRGILTTPDSTACLPGDEQDTSNSSPDKCGQPQSIAEPPSNQHEFSLTPVSQAEGLSEPNNSPPGPTPDHDRPAIQEDRLPDSTSQPSEPANRPTDQSLLAPRDEKTPSSILASIPAQNQEHDVRVAERLTTQPHPSQEAKPQPAEETKRPADHSVISPRTEKIPSTAPASPLAKSQESPVRVPDRTATPHTPSQDSKSKPSELVTRPIDHNSAPSSHEKSVLRPSNSKPALEIDIDTRLAEQGDAFAQYRLGRYYAQRDGRRTPESASWYKKAFPGLHRLAEAGNGQAMYVLGVMYAYGRGVTRSTDEARRWLTRAVDHKITAAQSVLSSLHASNPKLQISAQNTR